MAYFVRRIAVSCAIAALTTYLLAGGPAAAATFNRVVAVGDSLLDTGAIGSIGIRSPSVAEHLAWRLGATYTRLAQSGSTTTTLIAQGQHTTAAANFGPGDLAVLWIGGNDMKSLQLDLIFGNYSVLDPIEANLDTILATLRGAGMDVLVFNLFDFAQLPLVIDSAPSFALPAATLASAEWARRVAALAANHGAAVVDVFTLYQQLGANPGDFAVEGLVPVLAPARSRSAPCRLCIWYDSQHPSPLGQGIVANRAIADFNAFFDPDGAMPLVPLSEAELVALLPPPDPNEPDPNEPDPNEPPASFACPTLQRTDCVVPGRANVLINDRRAGFERIALRMARFQNTTAPSAFGMPPSPSAEQAVCVYDDSQALVGELRLAAGGERCRSRECWRDQGARGFRYHDMDAGRDGIRELALRAGDRSRGSIRLSARNHSRRNQSAMPTGISTALHGSSEATVQVLTSDGSCFSATFNRVQKSGQRIFRAVQR